MKHIKKIEAGPAQAVKTAEGGAKIASGKTTAPVLGGGCIPVGT